MMDLYLAELFIKGFLILFLVSLLSWGLRRASAATRHLVWMGGLGSLLLLPLAIGFLPNVPLPAVSFVPAPAVAVEAPPHAVAGPVAGGSVTVYETTVEYAVTEERASPIREANAAPLPVLVPAIWIGGGLLTLLPLACAWLRLNRRARRGRELASPEWRALLREGCNALRIRRNVRLLEGSPGTMPMTWGIRRPVVLLPTEAQSWPDEYKRSVLLHELAHIKRHDCLAQMLARSACAVHWFNPLVWFAYRRALATRERACDDLVLLAGDVRPSEYAKHLLSVARTFRTAFPLGQAAMPMARNSALEGRVRAVLNDVPRKRYGGRKVLLVVVTVSIAVATITGMLGTEALAEKERPLDGTTSRDASALHGSAVSDEAPSVGGIRSRDNVAVLNAAQPVRRIEQRRVSVNEWGEEYSNPLVIYTTAMDEGYHRHLGGYVEGVYPFQDGMRVGPDLLMWSLRGFSPPVHRTGYAHMRAPNLEPRWEFAPYENIVLDLISRDDLPTEFYGVNDPRGPEVFGESWTNTSVIVEEGDILFARLLSAPDTVYAIRFAEQGSSDYSLRDEDLTRYPFGSFGKMRIEYIVFSPDDNEPTRLEPESSSLPASSPDAEAGSEYPEETAREATGRTWEPNWGDREVIPGKDGVPPVPQVVLEFAILEVADAAGFRDHLASHGFDWEIGEAIALTESHSSFPEGMSNGISRQIIGMQSGGFSHERLIEMAERPGIEILSLPTISTGPGRDAMILIGDKIEDSLEDDSAIEPAIYASVVPLIAEDGETIRLDLLVSTVGSYVNPETEPDFRQVKLDDFEIREGGTAFVSGFTEGSAETGRQLFVFVTPEIRWP